MLALLFILVNPCQAASPAPAWGTKGMAATAHPLATEAARSILDEGGNAIDAALAAIYVLDVVTPYSEGLGGGEFWVVRWAKDGSTLTIDGRETAPAASTQDMYLDTSGTVIPGLSTYGVLAGGVPGSVAAREAALARYGSTKRSRIMRDAIQIAEQGFVLTPSQGEIFAAAGPYFTQWPTSAAVMFKSDTTTWSAGDLFVQRDLAETLKRISRGGADEFYRGTTAAEVVRFMEEHGGLITAQDMADYEPILREPVQGNYRGYEVYSMPPPSSGGIHLIQMLNMLEKWNLEQFDRYSSRYYHHLGEVMEAAFADRSEYLGDPAFVNVPTEGLTAKSYAEELRNQIGSLWERRVRAPGNPFLHMANPPDSLLKPSHTSHLSVIDKWGNMVALTTSVNTHFGSKVIVGGTGFFLNNTMDDFSIQAGHPNAFGLVGKQANAIAPGKRPLSSMTPTLILKDGEPFLSVGGAGGPRIITATLQTILNSIDFGADIQEAINDPRIHHQWSPDYLFIETDISPDCAQELHRMGHRVLRMNLGSVVQGVQYDPATGYFYGASDPRAGGVAAGIH